jgi:hypothetical protein
MTPRPLPLETVSYLAVLPSTRSGQACRTMNGLVTLPLPVGERGRVRGKITILVIGIYLGLGSCHWMLVFSSPRSHP